MRRQAWVVAVAWACGSADTPAGAPPGGGGPPVAAAPAQPAGRREEVDVDVLIQRAARKPVVIDVRTDEEWATGHVPGAVHVPLDTLTAEHPAIASLPADTPIYLVCRSGRRSGVAADRLAASGRHAINVQGGTEAWIAKGQPVEGGATP